MALHKMIRLISQSLGGEGYLNFMGNEFGHPEWIDFPREGNGNSYHHCRRQWGLMYDGNLRYGQLSNFDAAMNEMEIRHKSMIAQHQFVTMAHEEQKLIVYEKGDLIYIFNFPITLPDFYNPERGLIDTLRVVVSQAGDERQRSQEQSSKMNQVSSKLRAGMNREQFEEEKKGAEDLDAIQSMYFDCNALDRIAEQEHATAQAADPEEELKMDKDLGLFEMINAGDFSTVSGNPAAAQAASA